MSLRRKDALGYSFYRRSPGEVATLRLLGFSLVNTFFLRWSPLCYVLETHPYLAACELNPPKNLDKKGRYFF